MVAHSSSSSAVSRPAAASILFVFLAVSILCVLLPALEFISMIADIAEDQGKVVIDKGVYYLFGVGIALSFLLVDGFYNAILNRPISPAVSRLVSRISVGGLVLTLALPHLVHYSTEYVLENNRGYRACEKESAQWLFVRDIAYTQPGRCGD
jgi:hypothetical protein